MAIYRKVDVSFWQDAFVMDLTPEEKFFYLYLMTNTKTSQCGIYELPRRLICFETGYSMDTVEKLIDSFVKHKKIMYDNETNEVFLLNWVKFNWSNSEKVIARVSEELKELKNQGFARLYYQLCTEYGYSIDTLWIPERQEKEKEEEEETEEEAKTKEEKPPRLSPKTVDDVREAWNDLGLSQVVAIKQGTKRHDNLKARLNEYGIDDVFKAIEAVKESDFLQGKNDRGWRIDLGWLLLPNNFPKVLEGNYSNRQGGTEDLQRAYEEWANE